MQTDEGPTERFSLRRRGGVGLFLAVFFFYMLTASRDHPYADGRPIWEVADAIITRGEVNIATRWPGTLPLGKDGKVYAVAPLLQSLVHVPGAAAQRLIVHFFAEKFHPKLSWAIASHLAPAALGALTCLLFFGLCRRLGFSPRTAVLATVGVAAASTVWVYARYPYSEILQAACFTGFFSELVLARRDLGWRRAVLIALWAGLLVDTKIVFAASVLGAAVFLAWRHRARPVALARFLGVAALALVPFALVVLLYNHARWGSLLETGYATKGAALGERFTVGLWGLFLSPGKSIFLYSPPLVLGLLALPRFLRRAPDLAWAMLAALGPVVLFTAGLLYWSGDYAWGPRYLVFAVPVLMVPGCLLVEDALAAAGGIWRRRLAVAGLVAVLAWGGFVQVLGNAFHWDHWIRIQRDARIAWLGKADTAGTPFEDFQGVCGACFEDMHGLQWLPPFDAIGGHLWLLRHVPLGHDWVRAEKDAAWHRHTTLRLNIADKYERARVDWWFLDYGINHRVLGVTLLALMSLGVLGFGLMFVGEVRRTRAAYPPRFSAST